MKRALPGVLALVVLSTPAIAEPPSLRERLLGTWRLVSIENRDSADKPWEKRYGDNPRGYILYDATGHMAVQIAKTPPPSKFASGDDWKPTPEEATGVYLGYLAYFGTYTV